jgi:hypothetical protein
MWERDIHHELKRIADVLEKLYKFAKEEEEEKLPTKLEVKWYPRSIVNMSTNAVNLNLDATANAVGVVTELNNDGSVFKFDPTKIQVAVQDINVVTATVDPTTGNVTVKPVAVGSTQVVVQDSATNIASPNYTFTVVQVGPSPTSLSVSWTVTP